MGTRSTSTVVPLESFRGRIPSIPFGLSVSSVGSTTSSGMKTVLRILSNVVDRPYGSILSSSQDGQGV